MIVDSEIRHLPVPERHFAYACAYRNAADAFCKQVADDHELCIWPNAAVVLLLAAHAVELFLKGAIYLRDPATEIEHHCIDGLIEEYLKHYPEPSFAWDIPFKTEYLGFTESEIQAIKKKAPVPSILYRYPFDKGGKEWNTIIGFDPNAFLLILDRMKSDFSRIESQLT